MILQYLPLSYPSFPMLEVEFERHCEKISGFWLIFGSVQTHNKSNWGLVTLDALPRCLCCSGLYISVISGVWAL